jgi:5,10-methylenetetrahydromethanopterin reductase
VIGDGVGVIAHLENPSINDIEGLARESERAGAAWLGVADAFWWRDVWMLLGAAARVTSQIGLGPVVTNPYLRHRFHTYAALATLQELAGDRAFLGLAAGGSEVSGAAEVRRDDAGRRIEELVAGMRSVAAGDPLDPGSGRRLDVPLGDAPVLVAGRGPGVLRAAGRVADAALLWAIPSSDLERTAAVIRSAAGDARRPAPSLIWAPLIVRNEEDLVRARTIAAYGILNASAAVRSAWGVEASLVAEVRSALVAGGAAAAVSLVPERVVADVAMIDPTVEVLARRAAAIGASAMAVPAYATREVADQVSEAREVLAGLVGQGR